MSFTAPRRTLRRHRLAQAGTLGAALALSLTACGGDPEPAETTTAPPSTQPAAESSPASSPGTASGATTPAASPSDNTTTSAAAGSASSGDYVPASADGPAQNVPKPEMPAAMKEETEEGAEAAVEYFWDALHYAEQTGDTELLDETYSEYCEFCSVSSRTMKDVYDTGKWISGEEVEITSILPARSENGYIFTMLMDMSGGSSFEPDGTPIDDETFGPRENQPWIAEVAYEEGIGQWVIDEMTYHGRDEQ